SNLPDGMERRVFQRAAGTVSRQPLAQSAALVHRFALALARPDHAARNRRQSAAGEHEKKAAPAGHGPIINLNRPAAQPKPDPHFVVRTSDFGFRTSGFGSRFSPSSLVISHSTFRHSNPNPQTPTPFPHAPPTHHASPPSASASLRLCVKF